jgi:beta-glucosidase
MVLLRNDGVLPIAPSVRSIAVIGPAGADAQYVVGGSASVTILPSRRSEPLAAIRTRAGAAVTVEHAQGALADVPLPAVPPSRWMTPDGTPGVRASYWAGPSLTGEPAFTRREPTIEVVGTPPGLPESWSARWAARLVPRLSGSHRISLALAGIATVRIDGRQLLHGAREAVAFMGPACPLTGTTELVAGVPVSVEVEYVSGAAIVAPPVELLGPTVVLGWLEPDDSLDAAVATAARSDVAVVVVGFPASEGMDRTSLALPADQDELVRAVAAVNPRTVVVLNGGGPALTPWIGDVAAAIVAWLPGERFGAALAAVLFGDLDPGGRLPITFPCDDDQGPLAGHPERYPGVDGVCRYDEGPLVGYRWFDTMEEIPRFPFGHGGSYATVEHGPVSAELDDGDVVVRVRARNVSAREGSSRLQLYAESTGVPGAPRRTLVDVAVLRLGPGEEGIVELRAPRRVLEPPATEGGAVVTEVPVRATLWVGTSSASFLASIATVGAEHGLRVHASTPP